MRLARWQADWVAAQLRERGHEVELVLISTRGDRDQAQPIGAIGGDGLFTKELQRSLLANAIDLAVHSLKDLPTESVAGLTLGGVPERGPTGDVLVSRTENRWTGFRTVPLLGRAACAAAPNPARSPRPGDEGYSRQRRHTAAQAAHRRL